MSRRVVAISEWQASYENPIAVKAGETIRLSGRTDTWDGHTWHWAIAGDGRAGWIPDDLAESRHGEVVVKADYSEGEVLTGIRETHGWTWCLSGNGEAGWVPSHILRAE